MPSVTIRFYQELNEFLPPARRKAPVTTSFAHGNTVKALIEDLGVPHTEVDLVLVNGQSVDFSRQLRDGDMVSVYPVFESLDIGSITRVRSRPLRETRFALDVHLGTLARLLRMFGFDSLYGSAISDEDLVLSARQQGRIILTRDRGLLKRRLVTHGYLVRSMQPPLQVTEVLRRFDLAGSLRLFARCMRCNGQIARCTKAEVRESLPGVVAETYDDFSRCASCGRVYWKGSHWEKMQDLVAGVREALRTGRPGP